MISVVGVNEQFDFVIATVHVASSKLNAIVPEIFVFPT
jgi:hypothetical protein